MEGMSERAITFNQDLSNWAKDNVTDCEDFATDSALIQENLPTAGNCNF